MAITQEFVNLNNYFQQCNGVVLNDIDINVHDSVEAINQQLYKVYNTNIIATAPQCECGYIKSRFRIGHLCEKCGTVCSEPNDNRPFIWLRDIGHKFVNPMFWLMLRSVMDKKIDCLRWLSDTSYNPPNKPDYLPNVLSVMGGVRSYSGLIKNLESVIEFLKHLGKFKNNQSVIEELDGIKHIWRNYKNDLLSNYLPIPNKNLFVMEATSKGRFINLIVGDVVNIVNEWIRITSEEQDERKAEKHTAKAISGLAVLNKSLYTDYVISKTGIFRKHQYGARSPFTFRCTITCVPRPHQHDIVELPWSIGCSAYEPYILSKLSKRGYTYKEAQKLIFRSVDNYNETISEILDELVKESKYPGVPLKAQRNPSLLQGSAIRLNGVFKKDPDDKTASISKMVVNSMNGDFDGDQINFTILNDNLIAEELEVYSPYYTVPSLNSIYDVSNSISMQGPANNVITAYLKDTNDDGKDDFWETHLK